MKTPFIFPHKDTTSDYVYERLASPLGRWIPVYPTASPTSTWITLFSPFNSFSLSLFLIIFLCCTVFLSLSSLQINLYCHPLVVADYFYLPTLHPNPDEINSVALFPCLPVIVCFALGVDKGRGWGLLLFAFLCLLFPSSSFPCHVMFVMVKGLRVPQSSSCACREDTKPWTSWGTQPSSEMK